MPLRMSPSAEAFHDNLRTELAAGRPRKQALAIAYATKRRASGSTVGGWAVPSPRRRRATR